RPASAVLSFQSSLRPEAECDMHLLGSQDPEGDLFQSSLRPEAECDLTAGTGRPGTLFQSSLRPEAECDLRYQHRGAASARSFNPHSAPRRSATTTWWRPKCSSTSFQSSLRPEA